MGWKAVKDHYRISHIVQWTKKGLCIGSGYIHNIMVIGRDGVLIKRYDGVNPDLTRYQREMDNDPALLASLLDRLTYRPCSKNCTPESTTSL